MILVVVVRVHRHCRRPPDVVTSCSLSLLRVVLKRRWRVRRRTGHSSQRFVFLISRFKLSVQTKIRIQILSTHSLTGEFIQKFEFEFESGAFKNLNFRVSFLDLRARLLVVCLSSDPLMVWLSLEQRHRQNKVITTRTTTS